MGSHTVSSADHKARVYSPEHYVVATAALCTGRTLHLSVGAGIQQIAYDQKHDLQMFHACTGL